MDLRGHDNVPLQLKTVVIGGVKTACISRHELAELMASDCVAARSSTRTPRLIFDVNGHGLSLAATDLRYRNFLDEADLIHADGQVIVTASKLLTSASIPERTATTDFFHDAAKTASRVGLRFFLLGGTKEVNDECAAILRRNYPSLEIVGHRHGYFSEPEEAAICDEISASRADIVWVGLGKPREQEFCVRNRHRIKAGWLITCGGCFNYITGAYVRAPKWVQRAGFEWLHRVVTNPRQLFWRYLTTNPHALFLIATRTRSTSA
jgi:N-acetylglucosaminyldiphosphoundecaprenol N-acetyl-beta-D-mannosaminyltransferase